MDTDREPTGEIGAALDAVRHRIALACRAAGRDPAEVTLVAVSKTHGAASVQAALACGQLHFGENRVQEADAKFTPLRERPPPFTLHLIGGLQTNKADDAVRIADMIESVDRPSLAAAILKAAGKHGRLPKLLVQVNTGDEPQKSGVTLREAPGLIAQCRAQFGTALAGLMCIPPVGADPGAASSAHWRSSPRITACPCCRWACLAISRPPLPAAPPMCAWEVPFFGARPAA